MKTKYLTLGLLLLGTSAFAGTPEQSSSKSKVDAGTKGTQHSAQEPNVDPSNSAVNERHNQPGEANADRQSTHNRIST